MAIQMLLIYKDKLMAFQKFQSKTDGYSNAFNLQRQGLILKSCWSDTKLINFKMPPI